MPEQQCMHLMISMFPLYNLPLVITGEVLIDNNHLLTQWILPTEKVILLKLDFIY